MERFVIIFALIAELFNTAIISRFFLHPLAKFLSPTKTRKYFILLSIARFIFLLFLDLFLLRKGPYYLYLGSIFDFLLDVIGALVIMPILTSKIKKYNKIDGVLEAKDEVAKPTVKLTCKNCGNEFKVTDSACSICGAQFTNDNVQIVELTQSKE